jgi:hypothetical protein
MTRTRIATVAAVAAFAALALTGCSGGNAGGATTCGTFLAMNSDQQTAVITSFYESNGSDTSNGSISLGVLSANLYCSTVASNDDPISGING